jgi:predicted metallopeptidase
MATTLNLTAELERLIADIAAKVDEFRHIDPRRLLVCVNSSRSSQHGTFAKIHPLRFHGGALSRVVKKGRSSIACIMPEVSHNGVEMLYVIYVTLPRFMDRPLEEKLVTVFHELYHISPSFDGDIRRFPGRNFAHGSSAKKYNLLMERFVDSYLQLPASSERVAFLDGDMAALRLRYRAIVGRKMAMPKLRLERV